MKVIYTISNEYMDAWLKETEPFSFSIVGYSSINTANRNLIKVNADSIIGFVYNNDDMSEQDFSDICNFIDRILLISKRFTFIFVCKNKAMLQRLGKVFDGYDIDLKCIYNYEYIDNLIIREAITCLLKQVESPYNFDDVSDTTVDREYTSELNFTTLFPKYMDRLFEPIELYQTCVDTLQHDELLLELGDSDIYSYLYLLRSYLIRCRFEDDLDLSKLRLGSGNLVVDAVTLCVKNEISKYRREI